MTIPPKEVKKGLIQYDIVCSNSMYGAGQEGIIDTVLFIQTFDELEKVAALITKVNDNNCMETLKSFDFETFDLFCIVDVQKGSGGHSIKIEEIVFKEDTYTIHWSSSSPEGDATSVMTQPYIFGSVDKTSSSVKFLKD